MVPALISVAHVMVIALAAAAAFAVLRDAAASPRVRQVLREMFSGER